MADSSSRLLINEEPLQVLPSLAVGIQRVAAARRMKGVTGLNEALALQQLQYWQGKKNVGVVRDDRKWIFNSYDEWKENFPFWSKRTVERIFVNLEALGLVDSDTPGGRDRRKWYAINYAEIDALPVGEGEPAAESEADEDSETENETPRQSGVMQPAKVALSDTPKWRDATRQSGGMEDAKVARPSRQSGAFLNKVSETTTENTREHTHTARERDAGSADAGVCVGGSRYSFELRSEYAAAKGLGGGWLELSRDGRYDDSEQLRDWLARRSPSAVEARRSAPADNTMSLAAARDYVRSILRVGAQTDPVSLVGQLLSTGKISPQVRESLLAELPEIERQARAPSAA